MNSIISTTKEEIINAANKSVIGGFVNTDGDWCSVRSPKEFKKMLEDAFGFRVITCISTDRSDAVAVTECGLRIFSNGHISMIK